MKELPFPLALIEVPFPLALIEMPFPLALIEMPFPFALIEVPFPLALIKVPFPCLERIAISFSPDRGAIGRRDQGILVMGEAFKCFGPHLNSLFDPLA